MAKQLLPSHSDLQRQAKDRLSKDQLEFKFMVESQGGIFVEYRRIEDIQERGI